ncbi:MAG: hypothetical protein LBC25_00220, partial [Holosporales bacterium]|nr:hypothetical protein [Holosporales bacterium]
APGVQTVGPDGQPVLTGSQPVVPAPGVQTVGPSGQTVLTGSQPVVPAPGVQTVGPDGQPVQVQLPAGGQQQPGGQPANDGAQKNYVILKCQLM